MNNPELEAKLKKIREMKKTMVREFTRKSVDAINLSEQVALTHKSISDDSSIDIKEKKKLKKTLRHKKKKKKKS